LEDKGCPEKEKGDANIPEERSRGQADLLMEDKGWTYLSRAAEDRQTFSWRTRAGHT
jgi:hypothetical protein